MGTLRNEFLDKKFSAEIKRASETEKPASLYIGTNTVKNKSAERRRPPAEATDKPQPYGRDFPLSIIHPHPEFRKFFVYL